MDTTPLAALRSTELKIGGGLTFAAEAGASYRIRFGLPNVALQTDVPRDIGPLTLRWSPAALPANDALAAAGRIDGAEGERAGNNLGGTVEYGERSGPLAATTWFRWTAPADGVYTWRARRLLASRTMSAFRDDPETGLVQLAATETATRTQLEFAVGGARGHRLPRLHRRAGGRGVRAGVRGPAPGRHRACAGQTTVSRWRRC